MKSLNTLKYAAVACVLAFTACNKSKDTVTTSTPPYQVGQAVSDASPLSGSIKGTMLTGKTYTISGDVTINKGDTLLLQKGVKVNFTAKAGIIVKGTLMSLGTSDAPNWFTVSSMTKTDNPAQSPATDKAYSGQWTGINCDTTCALLMLKWTHIEYTGATLTTAPVFGLAAGDASFAVFFQNPNGLFVMEDSWLYGTVDDGIRVSAGKFSIMRNTFEKQGLNSGDCVNVKSGAVGDIAYNMFIGCATNGVKASNAGATAIQANINTYNNTLVNCGWRQLTVTGHGGSINYEKDCKGKCFNNMTINCRLSLRVVSTADTPNLSYGNTYKYGDSLSIVTNFYPPADVTRPQASDIPTPAAWLAGAAGLVGLNNPKFTTFTLPAANYANVAYVSGFDFHLQTGSPAIGKGNASALTPLATTNGLPLSTTAIGLTEVTPPGSDVGCYQSNGTGNKH